MYGAPSGGPNVKGAGATAAVFELAAYQQSDVAYWGHFVYGPNYSAPLQNVYIDGGPLNPACPAGDPCPPPDAAYNGDVEVDADIQMELTVAPDLGKLEVYEAPSDSTGQTWLDEYGAIANQDTAETISSSWGFCENDTGTAWVQAQGTIFEQMALQGQSMFAASGDTGAFECLRNGDGSSIINSGDPVEQPWVTGVGGTSFSFDNPGTNLQPSYPGTDEMAWNVDNLCNEDANEGGTAANPIPGYFWCGATGASGGAPSQFFGRPSYQTGPGVQNRYTTYSNGVVRTYPDTTTPSFCAFAPVGTPCRETPDVSANADPYTGYAEFCLPPPKKYDADSNCAIPPIGWFQIGGTSLSSPLWGALIADRDGHFGTRSGNINAWIYALSGTDSHAFFHDITGTGQPMNNNGFYPAASGYDEATGLGSPNFAAFITRQN
jgi:kumamolisin